MFDSILPYSGCVADGIWWRCIVVFAPYTAFSIQFEYVLRICHTQRKAKKQKYDAKQQNNEHRVKEKKPNETKTGEREKESERIKKRNNTSVLQWH